MSGASCPACGARVPVGARFCGNCGARTGELSEAHSRYMTVLFCDLSGSTTMTGAIGDEAMFALIRQYQTICNRVTSEHGGYVAKYMGDGMLAYFGFPDAMKNSAAQAVAAALDIIRKTGQMPTPGGTGLMASAGVATGWMVVGDAHAGAAAAEVMAIGSTVNLASRLQSEAGPGRVAVSPETGQRLNPERFALSRLGIRSIRGFAEPLEIWLAAEAGARAPAAVFVGRETLRARLAAAWQKAQQGNVVLAGITAPGGYGKTALAKAFLKTAVDESNVVFLRGEHHRSEQGFAAFRSMIRDLAGIRTAMPQKQQQAALQAWAPPEAAGGLAMLCDLVAEPVPPIVRSETIGRALRSTLPQRLPATPAVLFADDAHWLDQDSLTLVQELPELLRGRPLMVLITRRPEGAAIAVEEPFAISLERLEEAEAQGIIAALDTAGVIPAATRAQIAARAGGVPLYVEHMARAVLERPDHRLGKAAPVTMIEALHERFSHLGDALPLVEAAAILGQEFRANVLAGMLGDSEAVVSKQLSLLAERGLFRPRSGGTIAFDHVLIRDAVLDTLLKAKAQALHARALEAYEAAEPARLEAGPVIAATHLMGAGREAEAIPHLLTAARTALMRGEIPEAVRLLAWAREGLAAVPADSGLRNALEMAVEFSMGLALVQHRGFSDEAVARSYERALELCLADQRSGEAEFQIAWGIWAHYMVVGGTSRALQMTARMDRIAASEPALEVLASAARSLVLCNQGKLQQQEEAAARVEALYDPAIHRLHALTYSMDSLELAHLFRIHGRWVAGDLPNWQKAFEAARAHEAFLELPILKPYVRIYSNAPSTYALSAQSCRAELEDATAYAAEIGQPFWVVAGTIWLAHEAVRSKGPAEALQAMSAAVAQMHAIGLQLGGAYHEAMLGYCLACTGDHAAARERIGAAQAAIAAGRDLLYAAEVHRLDAETLLLRGPGDFETAAERLDTAAEVAADQGARAWSALTAASRARMKAAQDGQAQAEGWLAEELGRLALPGSEDHPAFTTARQAFTRRF
ncbi:adenylate/guanylate cyclase domain-containing protein [Roseobacteraceae bacterium NS-SX3]